LITPLHPWSLAFSSFPSTLDVPHDPLEQNAGNLVAIGIPIMMGWNSRID
jgi:hypothetical protein